MEPDKRLELQSTPDDLMRLAKDQFGPHFIQFELWVGKLIDMAYDVGKAQRAEGVPPQRYDLRCWSDGEQTSETDKNGKWVKWDDVKHLFHDMNEEKN